MRTLPSSRYATTSLGDRYSRHRIFVDMAGQQKDVLELGCSTGFLSQHLVENGCTVTGVEMDSDAAQSARSFCSRVETLNINDADWINGVGGPFDVILLGDVLEHLNDSTETLRLARTLLRDDGYVVISLPNVAHWSVRLRLLLGNFDYKETGILDTTHLRFFTRKSASRMIRNAGFSTVEFRPVIGGFLSNRFRAIWQFGVEILPGLFAFQLMFRAVPHVVGRE